MELHRSLMNWHSGTDQIRIQAHQLPNSGQNSLKFLLEN